MEGMQGEMEVFPTRVGMNRRGDLPAHCWFCVPHSRGDEPDVFVRVAYREKCSPLAWG